ncbi:hypothetical protein PUN28_002822 [Cardiocondyla obscurior]|uniref:Uncharacterized protein n=1 Tax=Cardiocondyla obscurior TaxID=286306 RepID=A0AAW2GWJ6_9HYME
MTSRAATPDDGDAAAAAATDLSFSRSPSVRFCLSRVENARCSLDSRNGGKSGNPRGLFHRVEKLKACCVNNEAESIGTSAESFFVFAHRNIVLSLS